MNFVRLVLIGAVALTIVYLSVAWYARSVRRERLEKEWDEENPNGNPDLRRQEVEQGVEEFRNSLSYRSLLLIYVVPPVLIFASYYITN